jgi:hypothetical protein
LDRTGEFTERGQQRYDDTTVVLQEVGDFVGGETDDRTGCAGSTRCTVPTTSPTTR